jgi:hypothetical protein
MSGLKTVFVGPGEFTRETLSNVSLIAFPGGNLSEKKLFKKLSLNDKSNIINYVKNGGRYIGICLGAFIAGKNMFGFSQNDFQQKNNMDTAQLTTVTFLGKYRKVYVEEPPEFGKDTKNKTVLSYFLDGTVNIFIQDYYKGKVALIASHPEADETWSDEFLVPNNTDIAVYSIKHLLK